MDRRFCLGTVAPIYVLVMDPCPVGLLEKLTAAHMRTVVRITQHSPLRSTGGSPSSRMHGGDTSKCSGQRHVKRANRHNDFPWQSLDPRDCRCVDTLMPYRLRISAVRSVAEIARVTTTQRKKQTLEREMERGRVWGSVVVRVLHWANIPEIPWWQWQHVREHHRQRPR